VEALLNVTFTNRISTSAGGRVSGPGQLAL
jgi:hypothetical protein